MSARACFVAAIALAACGGADPDAPSGDVDSTAVELERDAPMCPSAPGIPFSTIDPVERRLAAIGCDAKTILRTTPGDQHQWIIAFCPAGPANDALLAAYRHVHPYDMRVLERPCPAPAGYVVDEWDPGACASCRHAGGQVRAP